MEINSPRRIVFLIGLVLSLCLCAVLTGAFVLSVKFNSEQNASATSDAQRRAQSEMTRQAADARTEMTQQAADAHLLAHDDWPVVFSDHFDSSSNPNGWMSGDINESLTKGKAAVGNGRYDLSLTAIKTFNWLSTPKMKPVSDLDVSVDAQVSGSVNSMYGLFFREVDARDYYEFLIVDSKYFFVGREVRDTFIPFIDKTESSAIRKDGVNRLRVSAEGPNFMFFINQQFVGEWHDDQLTSGYTGIRFGLYTGETADFQFSNFEARAPLSKLDVEATATSQAVQPLVSAAKNWPVYFSDQFPSGLNKNDWPAGEILGSSYLSGSDSIHDGAYWFDVKAKQGVAWWSIPRLSLIRDFAVSFDAQRVTGPPDAEYGVALRYLHGDYYRLVIRDDKYFGFAKHIKGDWTTLIGWSKAEAIVPGGVNRITVIGQGSHFLFLVNNQYIGDYSDDSIFEGTIGVAFQLNRPNDSAVLKFSDFEIRKPPAVPKGTDTPAPLSQSPMASQTPSPTPTQTAKPTSTSAGLYSPASDLPQIVAAPSPMDILTR